MEKTVFQWDPAKAKAVMRERGLAFSEAQTVFRDPHAIIEFDDEHSTPHQDRWEIIGHSQRSRILTVIYCELDPKLGLRHVKIITCWKATAEEKARYAEGNGFT